MSSAAAAALENREPSDPGRQTQTSFGYSPRTIIFAIAAIALAIRLAPQLHHEVRFAFYPADSFQYVQLNNGLVHGCGFSRYINGQCSGVPELLRTPGYPVFLAAIPTLRMVLVVQSVMATLLYVAIAFLVARCWNLSAAIIAEVLLAIDVPSIVVANQFITETLFTVLLVVAVIPPLLLATRKRPPDRMLAQAALCGLAAAAAILARPIGIVLPIVVAIPFVLVRSETIGKRVAAVAIAVAIPMLAVLGWSIRNYRAANYFGLSSVGAINLYYYRAAAVEAHLERISLVNAQAQLSRSVPVPYLQIYNEHNQSRALENEMESRAERIFIQHPFETLEMTAQGTIYAAMAPMRSELAAWLTIGKRENGLTLITGAWVKKLIQQLMHSPIIAVLMVYQLLVDGALWLGVLFALVNCLHASRAYRIWVIYLTLVGLLFIGLAAGGEACPRFRVPVFPILAVVAGLGYATRLTCSPESGWSPTRL